MNGALVSAAYAASELDRFEHWVSGLGIREVFGLMDIGLSRGLLKGERLKDLFKEQFADHRLEELAMPFAAVATSLRAGAEVWLRRGSTLGTVRASAAVRQLFAPVLHERSVLVDDGPVNPVLVSLARAGGPKARA